MDQVTVRFTDPASPAAGDLRLNGAAVGVKSFSYDPATLTATWALAAPLAAGRLTLASSPGVVGSDGAVAPSGPVFRLDVLPGDATGDGRVNVLDWTDVRNRLGRSTAAPGVGGRGYSPFADVDGDGTVNAFDAAAVRGRLFTALPPLAAPAAPSAALFSARRVGLAGALV